jgi:MFS family permease
MSRKTLWSVFILASILMAAALAVHESVLNNFLKDVFQLGADARGNLELPREFPGFLVVVMAGLLCRLAVTHIAVVGTLVFAAGMAGMALWGMDSYGMMLVLLLVGSAGMHLLQPIGASIVMALTDAHKRGRMLGVMDGITTLGAVGGTCLVMLFFKGGNGGGKEAAPEIYGNWFLGTGALAVGAALFYGLLHIRDLHQGRTRFVFHKRYNLYYVLELLFGARKQIFITFGPWVLVEVYQAAPPDIARLFFIASLLGLAFKPAAGWAIDHFGERKVLVADGLFLAVICVGYGYAFYFTGDKALAMLITSVCFVGDNLLFSLGSGRAVYVSRLADSPGEVTSTLAMGISINHIASMIIPAFAGAVWMIWGYERVFAAAAVLAIVIAVTAARVPGKGALS